VKWGLEPQLGGLAGFRGKVDDWAEDSVVEEAQHEYAHLRIDRTWPSRHSLRQLAARRRKWVGRETWWQVDDQVLGVLCRYDCMTWADFFTCEFERAR
jgi:hypothetical protein